MQQTVVLDIAKRYAEHERLRWKEPVQAEFYPATSKWHVCTNVSNRGANLHLVIDDQTGQVERHAFHPR